MSSRSWVRTPHRIRFRGVMVSTLDFESNDPGSNPGETYYFYFLKMFLYYFQQNLKLIIFVYIVVEILYGSVPERSKGCDLRSHASCFVGSNPTATTMSQ